MLLVTFVKFGVMFAVGNWSGLGLDKGTNLLCIFWVRIVNEGSCLLVALNRIDSTNKLWMFTTHERKKKYKMRRLISNSRRNDMNDYTNQPLGIFDGSGCRIPFLEAFLMMCFKGFFVFKGH